MANKKYSRELEKLKALKSINAVLKKGDIEDALLSNSARDNETVSDTAVSSMLDNLKADRVPEKDIEVVERMTTYGTGTTIVKRRSTRVEKRRGKTKIRRSIRMVKRRGHAKPRAAARRKPRPARRTKRRR